MSKAITGGRFIEGQLKKGGRVLQLSTGGKTAQAETNGFCVLEYIQQ
ncbi:MAG: hypothetical protein ABEJ95_06120 [Candidatus Nanohalobium sp.]